MHASAGRQDEEGIVGKRYHIIFILVIFSSHQSYSYHKVLITVVCESVTVSLLFNSSTHKTVTLAVVPNMD